MKKLSLVSYILTASIMVFLCSSSEKNHGELMPSGTLLPENIRISTRFLSRRQIFKEIQRASSEGEVYYSCAERRSREVEPVLPPPPVPAPQPAPSTPPDVKDTSRLSGEAIAFSYKRNKAHTPPEIPQLNRNLLKEYGGFYVNNSSEKVIYLTFDEGYENGFTPSILDTLKMANVKASFFVTKPFIQGNPSLVKRMVEEGHSVLNHTVTHRSLNLLSEKEISEELKGVEDAFKNLTGKAMPKYVRPPKGEFSEKSLYVTKALGYRTIFWSISYVDWDTAKQPSKETALSLIRDNYHNGAIILLHAVSKTNAESLGEIIKILTDNGYKFQLIDSIK